jgi:hypothetical protein
VFTELPSFAAWRHRGAREGFEVSFFDRSKDGYRLCGHTTAVEDARAWSVRYRIEVDPDWLTRRASVSAQVGSLGRELLVEHDGCGHWLIDGDARPDLDGCLDIDLESSAVTNALPVHRLGMQLGEAADAPAVYVRALDLAVERLEQRWYRRVAPARLHQRYDYSAPRFGYSAALDYDEHGLVLTYPGLAERAA